MEWEKCGERASRGFLGDSEQWREKLNEVKGEGRTFKVIKTIDLNLVLFSFSRRLNRLTQNGSGVAST